MKVIRSLENSEILFKKLLKKTTSPEEGLLGNFLALLTKAGLTLMKNVLTLLPKGF